MGSFPPTDFRVVPHAKHAYPSHRARLCHRFLGSDPVADALAEIGNILTGTYLGAIHDFCALNVYHSVPSPGVDMLQALLDEFLANQSSEVRTILLITVKFMISDEGFKTFLLICPSRESCSVLVNSISGAERTYGVPVD